MELVRENEICNNYLNNSCFYFFHLTNICTRTSNVSLINVQTDNNNYDEGDIVVVSGSVTTVIGEIPVTLQRFIEGSIVEIVQITVAQDGRYSHAIIAEGQLWKEHGDYLVRVSYGEGNVAETAFSFTPKTNTPETTAIFEVNAGSHGTIDVEYTIKGGTVKDMIVDPDIFAIIVQIESTNEGTISLDLPREFIGAEKQDDKDDTFIILIDGIEVAYQESVVNSDSRVITINFEEGDSDIEIIGTFVVGNTINSSPSVEDSGISSSSTFRIIPEEQNVDRADFKVKNKNEEEKNISLRIGEIESRISESQKITLTAEIEKITNENDYIPLPRDWQTSGPF